MQINPISPPFLMACDVHKVNVEGNVMSPEAVAEKKKTVMPQKQKININK